MEDHEQPEDANHPDSEDENNNPIGNLITFIGDASTSSPVTPISTKKRKAVFLLTENQKAEKRWFHLEVNENNLIWLDTSDAKKEEYLARGLLRCKICSCGFKAYPSSGNIRNHILGAHHRLQVDKLMIERVETLEDKITENNNSSNSSIKPKLPISIENHMFSFLDSNNKNSEDQTLKTMRAWVISERKTIDSFIEESSSSNGKGKQLAGTEEVLHILTDLGLDTLLSIYCSRGENFQAQMFKQALKELGVPFLFQHILYNQIEKWRHLALNNMNYAFSNAVADSDDVGDNLSLPNKSLSQYEI